MNIDNITSESMTLTNNGKSTQIKVYEELIDKLQSNWNSLREWLEKVSQEEPMPRTEHFNWVYNNVLDYMNELESGKK